MPISIEICEEEMIVLEQEVEVSGRSLAEQARHWTQIGRAIERSPVFNYQQIRDALSGLVSPDDLTGQEQEVFFEKFGNEMGKEPSPDEEAAFIRYLGQGTLVGLDENDELVYRQSD